MVRRAATALVVRLGFVAEEGYATGAGVAPADGDEHEFWTRLARVTGSCVHRARRLLATVTSPYRVAVIGRVPGLSHGWRWFGCQHTSLMALGATVDRIAMYTSTMITRLDLIGIPSQDPDRARSFYRDTLGLRPDEHGDYEQWAGDTCFGIWEPEKMGCRSSPRRATHGRWVRRCRRHPRRLEAKGVEFAGDTFDTGVCHMAFFWTRTATTSCSTTAMRPTPDRHCVACITRPGVPGIPVRRLAFESSPVTPATSGVSVGEVACLAGAAGPRKPVPLRNARGPQTCSRFNRHLVSADDGLGLR